MTPEEKQQYIDELRRKQGEGLDGAEAMLWAEVNATADQLRTGRDTVAKLRRRTTETEGALLQITGRHQGAIDMLCSIEQQRRDAAKKAEEDAKAAADAKADLPLALESLPDLAELEKPAVPSVADCLSEINEVVTKAKATRDGED